MEKGLVIDGVDGVGKTTLGLALAEHFGFEYLDAPYAPYMESREQADAVGGQARADYYAQSNRITSWLLRTQIERPVVLDKYQMSTVAFGRAQGFDMNWQNGLWQPDATIRLKAESSVRDNRLDGRSEKPRKKFEATQLLDRADREYDILVTNRQLHGDRVITIDTTMLSPDEVFTVACEQLQV